MTYRRVDIPAPPGNTLADDVRDGLSATPPRLSPRFFYDAKGADLFEQITALPEYDLTRNERAILDRHAADIATSGPAPFARLVELGSGSSSKTRALLDQLVPRGLTRFAPVDISRPSLDAAAQALLADYAGLQIDARCGEYDAALADMPTCDAPSLWIWLGSSIGNLDQDDAVAFLRRLGAHLGADDRLLVGFDRVKDPGELERAYDDDAGVTAAFNANLLDRLNAELDAGFDTGAWTHHAIYQPSRQRVEMHLVARSPQTIRIPALGLDITVDAGQSIHTESSHKYTPRRIDAITGAADLGVVHTWTERDRFDLVLMSTGA